MSMLNKKGNVFTLFGIQEEKETLAQTEPETIRPEDVSSLIGKTGMSRQHYCHTEDDSVVQLEQRDQ